MSLNIAERARMIAYLLDKPDTITNRRARARWMVRRSSDLLQLGRKAEWRQALLVSIRENPWTLRPWAMLVAGPLGGPTAPDRLARLRNHVSRRFRHSELPLPLRRSN